MKGVRHLLVVVLAGGVAFAEAASAWTNVAGHALVGEVVGLDAEAVSVAAGGVTQRVARSVFPAAEVARMRSACGMASSADVVPPALAPAWADFRAKCAARTVTRGDWVGFKRFVAASGLPSEVRTAWTQAARRVYRESRKEISKGGK